VVCVSVAKLWLQNKKYKEVNMCTAALLWTLWKSRDDIDFQGAKWTRMGNILGRCASSIRNWRLLLQGGSRRPRKVDGGAGRPKHKTNADCMGAATGRGV
jgi:hypothetical protein